MLTNEFRIFTAIFILSPTILVGCNNSTITREITLGDRPAVVYGIDTRQDEYEIKDEILKQLGRSTVAFVYSESLVQSGNGKFFKVQESEEKLLMCVGEKFDNQPDWAFCSGSIIAEDLVLTAGHCVRNQASCEKTKIILDYRIEIKNKIFSEISIESVFSCAKLVYTIENKNGADFAILRLDRKILDRTPLELSVDEVTYNDNLALIGYPLGLPLKFAMNGRVRSLIPENFFRASLDAFSGSSGSAVINQNTYKIVGVLSRGEQDFERKNSCYVAKVCKEEDCRGEDVTRASEILKVVDSMKSLK